MVYMAWHYIEKGVTLFLSRLQHSNVNQNKFFYSIRLKHLFTVSQSMITLI